MAKVMYKYPIEGHGEIHVEVPKGAEFASFDVQHGTPTVWASVDPDEKETTTMVFTKVLTGGTVPEDSDFVGTAMLNGGDFIVHYFAKEL